MRTGTSAILYLHTASRLLNTDASFQMLFSCKTMSTSYSVAVRTLCEFTAKQGDLDLRFTPAPSALEGIAGHKAVTARREPSYESEITLKGRFKHLLVRGRADGYDRLTNQLEEIKTHRGTLAQMPANHRALHWAQAKIYGWLLCQQRELVRLQIALVYFDITTQEESVIHATHDADELETYFNLQCERFLQWAENESEHRRERDKALLALQFPYDVFRPGQRVLAEAVYRSSIAENRSMVQAPTGIGKTIGMLFAALKAMPVKATDKLYFLTAKTSGQQPVLKAIARLCEIAPTMPLRIVEIVARHKSCEHPDKACHGDSCPLARGFYDRLPAAREQALQPHLEHAGTDRHVLLRRDWVRQIALRHQLCPYYLTQELARWADVVIADYNYYFDASAMLFALTVANEWKVQILIDEAHNLVERSRSMYTANLSLSAMRHVLGIAPSCLHGVLDRLSGQWKKLENAQKTASDKSSDGSYMVLTVIPAPFRIALQEVVSTTGEFLTENLADIDNALLRFYFDALRFFRVVDSFGAHSLFDLSISSNQNDSENTLCIRNIVPAAFLKPRIAAAQSMTLFSATLGPRQFYQDMLGMPDCTSWVDVPSPFIATQLEVRIVERISTRFAHRKRSLSPIVSLIVEQFNKAPGNYLAFFSSFDYLTQVSNLLVARHPHIPVWRQSPEMNDAARLAFLARFTPGGTGIGFAVLGGAFSEGVDLPGDQLIGAFIATLGLPQLNPINEQIKQRMEATFAMGYDYTYLFPGMRKVVQAAGRVIRTPEDRGVVYLIDDRFAHASVRALLPSWWNVEIEIEVEGKTAAQASIELRDNCS